jgi:hypothetical protein
MSDDEPLDLSGDAPLPGEVAEYRKTATTRAVRVDVPFVVDTLEGRMRGNPGDFLAIGVEGERYPIAASVMAASYERTEGDA